MLTPIYKTEVPFHCIVMTLIYSVIVLKILLAAPIFAQSTPPLAGAIPLSVGNSYCNIGYDQCTSIGEPRWCCSSGARCVFTRGGGVACCDYSIPCDGEVSGEAWPPASTDPPATSPNLEAAATGYVSVTAVDGASRTEIIMMASPSSAANALPTQLHGKWRRRLAFVGSVLACFVP
jgi:hypothetical protein